MPANIRPVSSGLEHVEVDPPTVRGSEVSDTWIEGSIQHRRVHRRRLKYLTGQHRERQGQTHRPHSNAHQRNIYDGWLAADGSRVKCAGDPSGNRHASNRVPVSTAWHSDWSSCVGRGDTPC